MTVANHHQEDTKMAISHKLDITTGHFTRFAEVIAYAQRGGMTTNEAIVALVNKGLSHLTMTDDVDVEMCPGCENSYPSDELIVSDINGDLVAYCEPCASIILGSFIKNGGQVSIVNK